MRPWGHLGSHVARSGVRYGRFPCLKERCHPSRRGNVMILRVPTLVNSEIMKPHKTWVSYSIPDSLWKIPPEVRGLFSYVFWAYFLTFRSVFGSLGLVVLWPCFDVFFLNQVWSCRKTSLGGGFKNCYVCPLSGEDSQFDSYFSNGLKPPTSIQWKTENWSKLMGNLALICQRRPLESILEICH